MEAVPFYGRVKLVDLTDQSRTVAERVAESALECTEVRGVFPFPLFCFFSYSTPFADERPRRVGGDYDLRFRLKLSCGYLPYSNATSLI